MNWKKTILPIVVVTGILMVVNIAENALVGFGIVNPVVAGLGAVPIVTAILIVLLIWVLRKQKVADI